MTRLSIIIPAGDDVSSLEDTLVSVLTHRPRNCEILVPHAGSYEDPYDLHDEVRFLQMPAGSDAAVLVAKAMNMAGGQIVHLLAPGYEATDRWCDEPMELLQAANVAAVSPLVVGAADSHTVKIAGVAVGPGGRRKELGQGLATDSDKLNRLRPTGPTAAAAFYRREAIVRIGGWPSVVGHLADLDAALSLRCLGYTSAVAAQSHVVLRGREKSRSGAFARSRDAERLFLRHRFGLLANLARPLVCIADCLSAGGPFAMIAAVAGKFAAAFDVTSCRQHLDWLQEQHAIAGKLQPRQDSQPPQSPDRRAA